MPQPLADDLGRLCGGGAHLRGLRRVAVGGFTAEEAASPDDVVLLGLPQAVRDYAQLPVTADQAALVRNGRSLARDECGADGEGPWAVLGTDGELLAMYEAADGNRVKPAVVLSL